MSVRSEPSFSHPIPAWAMLASPELQVASAHEHEIQLSADAEGSGAAFDQLSARAGAARILEWDPSALPEIFTTYSDAFTKLGWRTTYAQGSVRQFARSDREHLQVQVLPAALTRDSARERVRGRVSYGVECEWPDEWKVAETQPWPESFANVTGSGELSIPRQLLACREARVRFPAERELSIRATSDGHGFRPHLGLSVFAERTVAWPTPDLGEVFDFYRAELIALGWTPESIGHTEMHLLRNPAERLWVQQTPSHERYPSANIGTMRWTWHPSR